MIITSPTQPQYSTVQSERIFLTSRLTSHVQRKDIFEGARGELIAAAVIVSFVTFVALVLVVWKLKIAASEDTTAATDLTYRQMNATSTAGMPESSVKITVADTATDSTSTARTAPPRPILDPQTLLCTYGTRTNQSTLFPDDGLCDLIFFDSVYKENQNSLWATAIYSGNLRKMLDVTSNYRSTEFGVAFAYQNRSSLRAELNKTSRNPLEVFWRRNVSNFGIVDMPAMGVGYKEIGEVYLALVDLRKAANKQPGLLKPPHIVLGTVPMMHENFYGTLMRDVFAPTLFISQGHYAFGDSEVPDCRVVPPTVLQNTTLTPGYTYDLSAATSALRKVQIAGGTSRWLVSVGMKGRWTTARDVTTPLSIGSLCKHDVSAVPFGNYAQVCRDVSLRPRLRYADLYHAMETSDASRQRMFVYDNEKALCKKLCKVKSQNLQLRFGVAVYDLEYEDYANGCADLNSFGAFSRLKMVRMVVDYYGSLPADASDCEDTVPCIK